MYVPNCNEMLVYYGLNAWLVKTVVTAWYSAAHEHSRLFSGTTVTCTSEWLPFQHSDNLQHCLSYDLLWNFTNPIWTYCIPGHLPGGNRQHIYHAQRHNIGYLGVQW